MNRRNVDYIARYNDRTSYPLVDNKLKTKLVVAEYGVRTPRLLQVVRQQHEISHFREMAEGLDGFAIKPAKGSGGKGITVITGRDGDHYVLTADLPGVDPGSIDVDVDGQLLTIRAERTLPSGEGVSWITREREAGAYLRQLQLGRGIDTETISASYRDGVLSVTLPVSEKAKPRKVAVAGAAEAVTVTEGATPAA
nr:sugar-transfer associated ATP-grasp domain-containing protein [uncultured Microbacterium sp.]